MSGHGSKERRQELAIAALLSEPTIEAAAQKAGISPRTLKNWLMAPSFKNLFRESRRDLLERVIGRLQLMTTKAAETLERNLTCGKHDAENRAAALILENSFKGLELADLEEKIEDLDRQFREMRDRHRGYRP